MVQWQLYKTTEVTGPTTIHSEISHVCGKLSTSLSLGYRQGKEKLTLPPNLFLISIAYDMQWTLTFRNPINFKVEWCSLHTICYERVKACSYAMGTR